MVGGNTKLPSPGVSKFYEAVVVWTHLKAEAFWEFSVQRRRTLLANGHVFITKDNHVVIMEQDCA